MSTYLNKAILTALALAALGLPATGEAKSCGDSGVTCLDKVDAETFPLPNVPYEPYDPYPNDPGPGGSNEGTGDGAPEPTPTTPPDPAACLNLRNTQPHGCTKNLATAGLQTPKSLIPSAWEELGDREMFPNLTLQFHSKLNVALKGLNECYANVLVDPRDCELGFAAQFALGGDLQKLGSTLDSWSFGLGLADVAASLATASGIRTVSPWVSSVSAGVGLVSISFNVNAQSLASLNQFNDVLYKARLVGDCKIWVAAMEKGQCLP